MRTAIHVFTPDKNTKAKTKFRDLTEGIWELVNDFKEATAIVLCQRGSDLDEDDMKAQALELDTYERFPKILIMCKTLGMGDDVFIPNHEAWIDSRWVKSNKEVTISFFEE